MHCFSYGWNSLYLTWLVSGTWMGDNFYLLVNRDIQYWKPICFMCYMDNGYKYKTIRIHNFSGYVNIYKQI